MDDISATVKKDLQQIADETDSLIMSFIAPESAVKRSPTSYDYASITTSDLYSIEKEVIKIKKSQGDLPKKLKFVIHTPGGSAFISTKIAKYLRSKFADITAYVPYEASSGGTVLCLGADRIVMDEISNLTPIDPQTPYRGTYISVASYKQAVQDIAKDFKTTDPDDLYPPYSHLCEKLDPVVLKEMEKKAFDAIYVAVSLLDKHIKDKQRSFNIAFSLVKNDFSHTHVIDQQEALDIGLELDSSQQELDNLDIFKLWVGEHLNDPSANHIVKCYIPKAKKKKEIKEVSEEAKEAKS